MTNSHAAQETGQSHAPDRLIYMANQIGIFFTHQPEDRAVSEIAAHLRQFWEKRMLAKLFAHLDAGGAGLQERVQRAARLLRDAQPGA